MLRFLKKIYIKLDDKDYKGEAKVWDQIIKEADKNGDGEIDYTEFIEMMTSQK